MAIRSASAKPAKCKVCPRPATMTVGLYRVCSYDCGTTLAKRLQAKQATKRAKDARKQHRADRRRTERLSDVQARTQAACNAYIHARDAGKPCFTCDATDTRMEAGHWLPVGRASSPARYHPNNLRLQCHTCNVHRGGGLHPNYRPRLTAEIGDDAIADLERLHHCTVKWNRDALEQLAAWFRAETRRLRRSSDHNTLRTISHNLSAAVREMARQENKGE